MGEFPAIKIVVGFIGISIVLLFLVFAIVSLVEKESRAAKKSFISSIVGILLFGGIFSDFEIWTYFSMVCAFLTICFGIYVLLSFHIKSTEQPTQNNSQIDERNTMFSRKEISNDEPLKKEYYQKNPHQLKLDETWRSKPGLMHEQSSMYHPLAYAAADASFYVIGNLKPYVNNAPAENKKSISKEQSTRFIREWSKKLGALDLGICETKPYHFYSTRGRGKAYGKKVENEHPFAIALTVEMDNELLACGPSSPTLMESAQQYLNSGVIALQLAQFIRNLGYEARAHIDGDYELICPLVARDAGLGEIGRMGLLMTPKLGPRVRIAVITTNLPLIANEYKFDDSVNAFCDICKKCADVCPSKAISMEEKTRINGNLRWQINQEKCFDFWCKTGTDCGRCMSVCPYSHPNNTMHNAVRLSIKYFKNFRPIALWMDDFFYGRKPKPKKNPEWFSLE